jgi:hypothetical protein
MNTAANAFNLARRHSVKNENDLLRKSYLKIYLVSYNHWYLVQILTFVLSLLASQRKT